MLSSISAVLFSTLVATSLAQTNSTVPANTIHAPTPEGQTPIVALGSPYIVASPFGHFEIQLVSGEGNKTKQYLANYNDRFGQTSFTTSFEDRLQIELVTAGKDSLGQILYNIRGKNFAPPPGNCANPNYTNIVVNSYGHIASGYASVVNTAPIVSPNSDLTRPLSSIESGVFVLGGGAKPDTVKGTQNPSPNMPTASVDGYNQLSVVYQDSFLNDHAAVFCLVSNAGIASYTLTLSDADQRGFAPCALLSLNVFFIPLLT